MADARRAAPILEVRGLDVYYGRSHALQGVDLTLDSGVLSVVGRNGMGKTTLCNAVTGLVKASGSVRLSGEEILGMAPNAITQRGIAYVRPHDLEVDRYAAGAEGIVVRLRRAHAIGPLAQLDLERADNAELIEAVIPNERYRELQLKDGETLVVRPRHKVSRPIVFSSG